MEKAIKIIGYTIAWLVALCIALGLAYIAIALFIFISQLVL